MFFNYVTVAAQSIYLNFNRVTKKSDTYINFEFFSYPDFSLRILIADDLPAFTNAWSSVFGESPGMKRLMCQWHVLRNWKKYLRSVEKDKSKHAKIFSRLRILVRQPDKLRFTKELSELLSWLSLEGYGDFRSYLENYYLRPQKMAQWVPYLRRKGVFNVNMAIESFHSHFKGKYLRRSGNRRLDFTAHALLKYVTDLCRDADIMVSLFLISKYSEVVTEGGKEGRSSVRYFRIYVPKD